MKKVNKLLVLIMLVLLVCGCNNKKEEEDSGKRVIPQSARVFLSNSVEKEILSLEEIEAYNKEIMSKTDSLYDLDSIGDLTQKEVKSYIESYDAPTLPKYNGLVEIKSSDLKKVLDNRNLKNIKSSVSPVKGIVVKRTNLKSMPTDMFFYKTATEDGFDRIQETELLVNTPVLIIHTSKDGEWYFVISQIYAGWVSNQDIAVASDEDWEYFINNDNFGIITSSAIKVNNLFLDMSVKLPYVEEVGSDYKLVLPQKGTDDKVVREEILVSKKDASIGYLPYTKNNVIEQSFMYEGVSYSWGGMDRGVDGSSYVANVYRTFGFNFPRNTSDQIKSIGEVVSLEDLSVDEKIEKLKSLDCPALLYKSGQAIIFVGFDNEMPYGIYATSLTSSVKTVALDFEDDYIQDFNKLVLIK